MPARSTDGPRVRQSIAAVIQAAFATTPNIAARFAAESNSVAALAVRGVAAVRRISDYVSHARRSSGAIARRLRAGLTRAQTLPANRASRSRRSSAATLHRSESAAKCAREPRNGLHRPQRRTQRGCLRIVRRSACAPTPKPPHWTQRRAIIGRTTTTSESAGEVRLAGVKSATIGRKRRALVLEPRERHGAPRPVDRPLRRPLSESERGRPRYRPLVVVGQLQIARQLGRAA